MTVDLLALDRRVARLVDDHRRAARRIAQGLPAPVPHDHWLTDEGVAEIAEIDDPVARGLLAWLEVLREERRGWDFRRRAAAVVHAPRRVAHLERATTLGALRRGMIAERSEDRAAQHAEAFARHAGELSDVQIAAWVERLERAPTVCEVAGLSADVAVRLAEALLDRTDDLARARLGEGDSPSGPVAVLRAALGREANAGWPAKLNAAWLEDRFRPAGWLEGRRPRGVALVPPLGATSFARAMGNLGVALLEAARPAGVPFGLHRHPHGLRGHRRRALFAGLVGSEAFGRRALGLGRDRAREQARHVARAFVATLRIDAFRPLIVEALAAGEGAAREGFCAQGERVFGRPPPLSWLGALPTLRPRDAGWVVGCVLAAEDTRRLVERFDEDWFDNPRAAEALRDEDARGGIDDEALDAPGLSSLVDRLARDLEHAAG